MIFLSFKGCLYELCLSYRYQYNDVPIRYFISIMNVVGPYKMSLIYLFIL